MQKNPKHQIQEKFNEIISKIKFKFYNFKPYSALT